MKKIKFFCICLVLALSCLPFTTASASYNAILEELEPRSEIIFLQSLEDDTVIFDQNAHQHTPPASLTKLVTAILTLENVTDLDAMVTVPQSVMDSLVNTNSSNAGLKAGEEVSVADLLRCMLIPSANEAAATLAHYVSGGNIEGFVDKMNVFAHRLGCADTNFTTPHGLDANGQYTCAADVAKIMKYALTFAQSELFTEIISSQQYMLPASNMHEKPRAIQNTNKMLFSGIPEYYCEYVVGGKTGSTSQAGKCVAAIAQNGGYSYIAVIMNAPNDDIDNDGVAENGAFTDAKLLFEWVFKFIRYECVLAKTEVQDEVEVRLSSKTDHVSLVPEEDLYAYVPVGVDEKSVLVRTADGTLPPFVNAPVRKGDKIAEAAVYYADEEIARADLVASEDVNRNFLLYIGSLIGTFFRHPIVRTILIVLALLIAGYVSFVIYANRQRQKKRRAQNNRSKVVNMKDYKK